jgi:hypothetical protein
MIRTVYIASILGIMTFFVALGLGVAWGIVIESAGLLVLVSSFGAVGAGLLVGAIGFGLGLLFFRKPKAESQESDVLREAEATASGDGRERIEASRY